MSLYDAVRALRLTIDDYVLDGLEQDVSSGFLRKTTLIRLRGGGEEGVGEDVTYAADEHDLQQSRGPVLPLEGDWTVQTFSEHLAAQPLFDHEPEQHAYLDYRRWGFESAALDLALRQAGLSLGAALGRMPAPLTFVVSMRLGEPATTDRLHVWLELYPGLRFKLDAAADWSAELIAELAATGAVDSVDFKGHYHGTRVDAPPDPDLYRRVVDGLPDAWLEDPALTPETEAVLEPHRERVTWDAVIHSVADIEALPWPPPHGEREAVPLRLGRAPLRRLRALRRTGNRRVRGRPIRAGRGSRADPTARLPLPPRHAERRGAQRLQRRSAARPAREPARARAGADRVPAALSVRSAWLRLERGEQVVDVDERQRLDLRAPSRPERD